MGYAPVTEVSLSNNRRVDIVGLNKKGKLLIIEVKSGLADFRSDQKWQEYLPYCSEFYFAVDTDFPLKLLEEEESLPDKTGIIIADQYGAEILRPAAELAVNGQRTKTFIQTMARTAALRLHEQNVNGMS